MTKLFSKIPIIVILLSTIISLLGIYHNNETQNGTYKIAEANLFDAEISSNSVLDDGPYIFIESDHQGISKSIVSGKVVEKSVELDETNFRIEATYYEGVKKIAALSDIHGQLDVFIEVLKSNNIIDDNNNWLFGDGHLVITGDIFDRGSQVTETLWFVYDLEKQAKAAGGKVHYLLGNHEYMVLDGDLRYIHDKYNESANLLGLKYPDLFSNETVLGKWIRSKSTIIKINDILFVHGGLSQAFVNMNLSLEETNQLFRESIDVSEDEFNSNDQFKALYSSNGPIWYRGYFIKAISKLEVESILNHFNAKNIIVGHTSQSKIVEAYDGLVYVVDSSIKNGKSGEVLFTEEGRFYRGKSNGKKIQF